MVWKLMRQEGSKWFYRRVTIYDKGVTKAVGPA